MNNSKENLNSISIVILTRNRRKILENCLSSISNQNYKPEQIIVIDNASSDDTINFLKNCNLNLEIIENKQNLGFAKSINQGIKKAKGYYTLLLGDDIVIESDCLINFLRYIKNSSDTGLLGGYIYNYYNKRLIFSGKKIALRWGLKQNNLPENQAIRDTDLIAGSFLFSKTKLLKQFEGFDEIFFLYFEDLDLAFRFKRAGYRNLIISQAKAYHLEEELGIEKYKNNEQIKFELVKNIMIVYFKYASLFWLVIFFIRYMLFGFIKGIFNKEIRMVTLRTRLWVLSHVIDLIKTRWKNQRLSISSRI